MTDLYTAPAAPAAPVHIVEKKSHRALLIGVIVASVLVLAGVAGYGFHEHQSLGKSQAHAASVSSQLTDTQKHLTDARASLKSSESENQTLTATAKKCSVLVPILRHNMNALRYMGKSISGNIYDSLIWTPMATSEIKQATGLFNSHQSYSGELMDVCGPSSVTNS